jgi:hypothetical protein
VRLTKKSLCPKCPLVGECDHKDNREKCAEYNKANSFKEKHKHEYDSMPVRTTLGEMKRHLEDFYVTGYKTGYEQAYYELSEKMKGRKPVVRDNAEEVRGCLSFDFVSNTEEVSDDSTILQEVL